VAVLQGDFEQNTAAYAKAVGAACVVLVSHDAVSKSNDAALESRDTAPGRHVGYAVLLR
jgi:hypothetical protein